MGDSYICYRTAAPSHDWAIYRVRGQVHEPVLYFHHYREAARMLRALRNGLITIH